MLSVILYGRNDSYGYNLHKRAALSFNCIAQVLSQASDEIIFVDYNTPDDFPTFPEAIADTLTDRAKQMLRVLRVRPNIHDALFSNRTHLKALESIARNVALRHSNPDNTWILSTNTDMIFVPRIHESLTDAVKELPLGIYCTARFEIPETIWEGFDRLAPVNTIAQTRQLGEELHLHEVVRASQFNLYDGPGDFQLMPRRGLFEIDGFDEKMLVGWHIDSNISKRLYLKYGAIGDALPFVLGYHCDHTRQITPSHAPNFLQNDLYRFFYNVTESELPSQRGSWGLAAFHGRIEEIRISSSKDQIFVDKLKDVLGEPQREFTFSSVGEDSYGAQPCPPKHLIPFLIDLFASRDKTTQVCWVGEKGELADMFSQGLVSLDFTRQVVFATEGGTIPEEAHVIVVNMALVPTAALDEEEIESKSRVLLKVLVEEYLYEKSGAAPRLIIVINAQHNHFSTIAQTYIDCARTPYSTRLSHGFINDAAGRFVEGLAITNLVRIESAFSKAFEQSRKNGPQLIGRVKLSRRRFHLQAQLLWTKFRTIYWETNLAWLKILRSLVFRLREIYRRKYTEFFTNLSTARGKAVLEKGPMAQPYRFLRHRIFRLPFRTAVRVGRHLSKAIFRYIERKYMSAELATDALMSHRAWLEDLLIRVKRDLSRDRAL